MMSNQPQSPRMLTLKELAALVKGYRALRGWTQEDLAALTQLDSAQINAVEDEQAAVPEIYRALGYAFGFNDPDMLSKPVQIPGILDVDMQDLPGPGPTTVEAYILSSGEELTQLLCESSLLVVSRSFEMGMQADKVFEALVDYAREYQEHCDKSAQPMTFEIELEFQEYLVELKGLGVSVSYATHFEAIQNMPGTSDHPSAVKKLILVAFPKDEEPDSFLLD